jgi:type I restriction-modification system DNA methylase subunit
MRNLHSKIEHGYTPVPIASFMCREAIKEYLISRTLVPAPQIESLVEDFTVVSEPSYREQIIDALDRVRIIDPACGDGVLLTEALKKIFAIYAVLTGVSKRSEKSVSIVTKNLFGKDIRLEAIQKTIEELSKIAEANITPTNFIVGDSTLISEDDICAYDIVLTNPPYGEDVPEVIRSRFFSHPLEQSKEIYGIFIAMGLKLLKPGGILNFLVSNTWRTIRSMTGLRLALAELDVQYTVDLPPWVFGKVDVNTGLLLIRKVPAPLQGFIQMGDLTGIPESQKDFLLSSLEEFSKTTMDFQSKSAAWFVYPQKLIREMPSRPFFIASPSLYSIFQNKEFKKLGEIAEVKQGLATANNKYYLRKSPLAFESYRLVTTSKVLTNSEVFHLTENEKKNGVNPDCYGGRHFIPYEKGSSCDSEEGWLPNYFVPPQYYIDWSNKAVERLRNATIAEVKESKGSKPEDKDKERVASRFQNEEYYFKKGIAFSWVGTYAPTFRLKENIPFDHGSSCVFPQQEKDRLYLLAILCSKAAKFMMRQFINHSLNFGINDLKEVPILYSDVHSNDQFHPRVKVVELVKVIIENQQKDWKYDYRKEQREIDELVYELYGFSKDNVNEVKMWYSRRYPQLGSGT